MTFLERQYAGYQALLDAIPETEIAWFSGWLCADGSIKSADRHGRPVLRFYITDKDPLDKIARLFGGTVSGPYHPTGLGTKQLYEWKLSGWKVVKILQRCFPWLSERYKERASQGLRYNVRTSAGRKLTPALVSEIRDKLTSKNFTGRQLAQEYGVSGGFISAIKTGRAWTENVFT